MTVEYGSPSEAESQLTSILRRAHELEAAVRGAEAGVQDSLSFDTERLKRSVIRPLGDALQRLGGGRRSGGRVGAEDAAASSPTRAPDPAPIGTVLWRLALDTTRDRPG